MPKGTRVHNCVDELRKKGFMPGKAIPICQASTKQSFHTGKPLTSNRKKK